MTLSAQEARTVKRAPVDDALLPVVLERWSPRSFDSRDVSPADLKCMFEAARWAPSSFNEQPWRFILAAKDDRAEFARLLSCLVEGNSLWAKAAPE